MLGLAITARIASFMAGVAANVSAFNTVGTYDLYQDYIAGRGRPALHLVRADSDRRRNRDLDGTAVHRQGLRETS
jgi:hypothetical protein